VRRRQQLGDVATPKKLITAATVSGSLPGHRPSNPALAGASAAISARCAPAELPTSTRRAGIEPVSGRVPDHPAQRAAAVLTAAGAGRQRATR
jgi:hypothetical protein